MYNWIYNILFYLNKLTNLCKKVIIINMELNNKKYLIITYGCQMNVHESEKIAGALTDLGLTECDSEEKANVIVFNTCCIRENAEDKAEGNIGALKKLKANKKDDLIIAVGGCMTQQKGYAEKLKKKFPFIDIIFGTFNLEEFKQLFLKRIQSNKKFIEVLDIEKPINENVSKTRTSYPNAWVNIIYGCNNFCSYCIVPYVRGRERSRKPEYIINEIKELIKAGYKEITLLGQNVNSYGKDLGYINFANLIREIDKIDGKFRLSFMTNHPKDLSEDLILALSKSKKASKKIHLPVQSGSNKILKLMNRHYTRENYLEKVALLKKHIPDISITSDIMIGFPTETEEDFIDTLNLVKQVQYTGAFTFIYSKRKGTPASIMEEQIDSEVAKNRIMRLIDAQNEISRNNATKAIDTVLEVLCEDYDEKKNCYLGRDAYGRMVYFKGSKKDLGNFVNVYIEKTEGISLLGRKND